MSRRTSSRLRSSPVWINAVGGHEHALRGGGAADLQLGDFALQIDPLQLEPRHHRLRRVGSRHARVAARRKTLHAIKVRPGDRQLLPDLLELEPCRGQAHLEVLLEGSRVQRRPGLPFGVELAHGVDIPPQLLHNRLGARDLARGALGGAGIVVPVANRHDQAVRPYPFARLGQARIEIAGNRRGGDVDPAGHRGLAAHRGAEIGRQLPAGAEQDDGCHGTTGEADQPAASHARAARRRDRGCRTRDAHHRPTLRQLLVAARAGIRCGDRLDAA
jgi:hypothetical protein